MVHSVSNSMTQLLQAQRKFFESGETRKISFRIQQLIRLRQAITQNEELLLRALAEDLHKSSYEAFTTEIGLLYTDIGLCLKKIKNWARPRKVATPLMLFGAGSYIYPEPYGSVLIIGPFNYPVNLVFEPLIGAIAAGNCAVIKPSGQSPSVAKIIENLIRDNFAESYISTADNLKARTAELVRAPFDYIFFTGSPATGRLVLEAAASNLVPVTLELGGKSPCLVDAGADIESAARKIVWGKFSNAGQTCVAPDYLLVHKQVKSALISRLQYYIELFYGPDPQKSADFGRIVNSEQTTRLASLIDPRKVVIGGQYDIEKRYIAPTVLDQIGWDDKIMAEEIFGPLLPVLEYEDLDNAIRLIHSRPKPLAMYIFTSDRKVRERVLNTVSFGGGCINDVLVHVGNPNLPFGGVGASGMGAYHGQKSFDTFSHMKSILRRSFNLKMLMPCPPYGSATLEMVRKFMK